MSPQAFKVKVGLGAVNPHIGDGAAGGHDVLAQHEGGGNADRLGNCQGRVVPHELVKQSAMRDARLVERNVVAVCWFHNSWIEDHPYDAQHYGVCIPRWVYDMHGEAAFDEADRLRALVTFGQMGEPFWIAEAEQAPDGYRPRA